MKTLHDILADQGAVDRIALAILVSRFYDCEPEMYNGKDDFCVKMIADSDNMFEAQHEARAAVKAMIAELAL